MQQALIAAQELGDEKMSILQTILDKIEVKTRLLDQDHKNLGNDFLKIYLHIEVIYFTDFGKEETTTTENKEQQVPTNNTSSTTSLTNNDRPSKRARRTRNDTFSNVDANQNESGTVEHILRSQVASTSTTSTVQNKKTHGKV